MRSSLPNRIANSIMGDYISSGRIPPGDRLPPMRDLAREYSASSITIVQAVGLLEEWGYVEKRHGSGCYVKRDPDSGEGFPDPSPRMLGLILPMSTGSAQILMHTYRGVEQAVRRLGYHLVVSSSDSDYLTEREQVRRLMDMGCEAAVIFPVLRTRKQFKADYLKTEFRDFPIVLVDIAYPEQERSQVVFDNYRAGYDIAQLLIEEGFRRIAFLQISRPEQELMHKSLHERYRGYKAALSSSGISFNEEDVWVPETASGSASQWLSYLLAIRDQAGEAVALIASEDATAMHVISTARELGVRVPEQLKVAGFDDLEAARSFTPSFPTTSPDFVRAGEIAAERAIEEAKGTARGTVVYVFPAPVNARNSPGVHNG